MTKARNTSGLSGRFGERTFLFVCVAGASAVGMASATAPGFLLLGLGGLLTLALLTSATGRLVLVLAGAIGSLQSAEGASVAKLGFLALLLICGLVALVRVPAILADPRLRYFRWMPMASTGLMAYLLLTAQIALANGNGFNDWARDIVAYLILAIAPLVGLDAAAKSSVPVMSRIVVALGIVSSIAFMITWLSRRGFTQGTESLGLASMPLCVLPFAYGIARGFLGPHRWRWLALAVAIPLLLLTTGTRTALVFGLGLLGLIGAPSKQRVGLVRVFAGGLVAGLVILLLLPQLSSHLTADPQFLTRRLGSIQGFLTGSGPADESYVQRSLAYDYADSAWRQHFLLGTGPGHYFPPVAMNKDPALQLDTPLTLLAKFGVLGTAIFVIYLAGFVAALFRTRAVTGYCVELTAARVTVVVMIALAPFASLLDDKGVGLTMMVLAGLIGARAMTSPCPIPIGSASRTIEDQPESRVGVVPGKGVQGTQSASCSAS